MKPENPKAYTFLSRLHTMVKEDTKAQASLYDIGNTMGIDRGEAEALAQELYIQEFAEMKTLSGGMGITAKGLSALGAAPAPPAAGSGPPEDGIAALLNKGPVLAAEDLPRLHGFLDTLKTDIAGLSTSYAGLEELVMDMKTMAVQLLSPRPKTYIIREICRSLAQNLQQAGAGDTATRLKTAISS